MSPAPRGLALAAAAWLGVVGWLAVSSAQPAGAAHEAGTLGFEWIVGSAKRPVEMRPAADGGFEYRVRDEARAGEWLDAARFQAWVAETARGEAARPLLLRVVNVSSWKSFLWVLLGLGGQLCFFGRMFLQWWASERAGTSVVPPVFWWLSLFGAAALLSYFVWRHDPIGMLGQSAGFFVYARNLWLLHGDGSVVASSAAP